MRLLPPNRGHRGSNSLGPIVAITFFSRRALADGSIVTISDTQNYGWQDACVQGVVWTNERSIPRVLGCPQNSGGYYLNNCFCRADLVAVAHSFLSSAIPTACSYSPEADLSSAIILYDNYCSAVQATSTVTGYITAPMTTYTATPLAEAPSQTYTGGVYTPKPSRKKKFKDTRTGKIVIGVLITFAILFVLGCCGKK